MAAAGLKTLPTARADFDFLRDAIGSRAVGARTAEDDPATYVAEVLRTSRELAKRRSPEETMLLERQLEEREG